MSDDFSRLSPSEKIFKIVGAAMEVHNQLKCGFTENIYQEALAIELGARGIPFEREKVVNVYYKGHTLQKFFRPDFVCYDDIIVETKAISSVGPIEEAQVIGYLKATGFPKCLLLNFGTESLYHRTYSMTRDKLVSD